MPPGFLLWCKEKQRRTVGCQLSRESDAVAQFPPVTSTKTNVAFALDMTIRRQWKGALQSKWTTQGTTILNTLIRGHLLQPYGRPVALYPAKGILFTEIYSLRNKKTENSPTERMRLQYGCPWPRSTLQCNMMKNGSCLIHLHSLHSANTVLFTYNCKSWSRGTHTATTAV